MVSLLDANDAQAQRLQSQQRILDAARAEVVARGILGMRVAAVAASAGCSLTLMYRYFGSREGLLAEVLLGLYEESFARQFQDTRRLLEGSNSISVEDVLECIPLPHGSGASKEHSIRNQVLAVASTNPILRSRLSASLREKRQMLGTVLNQIDARLPDGVSLDHEVFTTLIFNINWIYNDLLGDIATSNEQYRNLMRRLIVQN